MTGPVVGLQVQLEVDHLTYNEILFSQITINRLYDLLKDIHD
uniref:Uncharacterized protein n=1 Tax=Rhizophora mucronata TaxID=61149 RepID=A0A2P2IP48_RHIMU